jgi:hypothetical protein
MVELLRNVAFPAINAILMPTDVHNKFSIVSVADIALSGGGLFPCIFGSH